MKRPERVRKGIQSLLLVGVVAAAAIRPGPAFAENGAMASEAGIGAGAALCSLIYGPVKVAYATLGVVFGGMAWGLSGGDSDVIAAVITPAVRGDYVVTPAILRGEQPLEFFGRRPGYERDTTLVEEDLAEESY